MHYTYEYIIGLRLVNPEPKYQLCSQKFKEIIHMAEQEYNRICSNKKNNPKEISIREIGENSIVLKLYSQIELSTPGKSLRSFSQILIQNQDFAETFVFGKQLFTSYDVTTDLSSSDESLHITTDDISDSVFLSSLVSYFLNKRDSDTKTYMQKRKVIEKMKIMSYDCGIVKLEK